jgi:hypothetical protein
MSAKRMQNPPMRSGHSALSLKNNRCHPYLEKTEGTEKSALIPNPPLNSQALPMASLLVLVSHSVILPGSLDPQPATILVDIDSGKIVQVRQGHIAAKDEYRDRLTKGEIVEWIEVPEGQVVLPGLVE